MKVDISSGKAQTQFVYRFSLILHRKFCDNGTAMSILRQEDHGLEINLSRTLMWERGAFDL